MILVPEYDDECVLVQPNLQGILLYEKKKLTQNNKIQILLLYNDKIRRNEKSRICARTGNSPELIKNQSVLI